MRSSGWLKSAPRCSTRFLPIFSGSLMWRSQGMKNHTVSPPSVFVPEKSVRPLPPRCSSVVLSLRTSRSQKLRRRSWRTGNRLMHSKSHSGVHRESRSIPSMMDRLLPLACPTMATSLPARLRLVSASPTHTLRLASSTLFLTGHRHAIRASNWASCHSEIWLGYPRYPNCPHTFDKAFLLTTASTRASHRV